MADVVRAAGAAKTPEPGQKKAGVTIDNASLVTDPNKGRLSTSQPAARPAAATPGARVTPGASVATATPPPSVASAAAEEQKWRDAARAAAKRVEDAKLRVEELDAAAHKLENDFYAWDDGQYRDRVIKPAWDKTKVDLETARKELADAEKNHSRSARTGAQGGGPAGLAPGMSRPHASVANPYK